MKFIKKYLPLLISATVLLPVLFTPSCANTTEAPTGGKKDTIPPVIVGITPLPGTVRMPVKDLKIVFTFNEYITLKNPQGIFLSPPLEKMPKSKARGKNLEVSFDGELKPGTTYTLDLGDAIVDNNESNPYAGFTYVFSTGEKIDSMYITGCVLDCEKLEKVKGVTVMLYKDHSDSALFLHRPDYATKTDDWGFFSMPYIQDTLYRLYAVKDETGNNIYDPETDLVGFVDSLIRPVNVVNDTTYELYKFDMKDTLDCDKRIADYSLKIFKEKQTKQYIKNSGRINERLGFVSFQAADTWIDSVWIAGYKSDKLITQFNLAQDSLLIWVNDKKIVPDTLHTYVKYRKTDSLGRFVPDIEHLKLYREGYKRKAHSSKSDIKREDTTCVFKVEALPENIEQNGFVFTFDQPIIYQNFNGMTLKMINPKRKETFVKFDVVQDSMDVRNFSVFSKTKILPGHDFVLHIPEKSFRDIAGSWSDSTEVKVTLPTDETLSNLILKMENVKGLIIVDLMEDKGTKPIRSFRIEKDCTLDFPYLKEGKYVIRISEDRNRNGLIDSGNILLHLQPEQVVFYQQNNDKVLQIPKSSEIEQTIDLSKLL